MFTGIVEELGSIRSVEARSGGVRLQIRADVVLEGIKNGDSVCIDGCCLTVADHTSNLLQFDVVPETLNRTTLQHLQPGFQVNLERAMNYQTRLGGHWLQGHVDAQGYLLEKRVLADGSWWVTVAAPQAVLRYAVYKGPIAVDGVSLTLAELRGENFSFAMIPHTAKKTTLGFKKTGDAVNLEADLMAKYVERLISPLAASRAGSI